MNGNEPLDLSVLGTTSEPDRWNALVGDTLERVDSVLARRGSDPLRLIATWARPILLAAAAAVVTLVPIEIALEAQDDRVEQVERLVALSTETLGAEAPPSGSEFLRALRSEDIP